MLPVTIPAMEQYNELNKRFIYIDRQELKLEHSLVSISKWESKWCKSFLSSNDKTTEEILDYIRCMTLNEDDVDERIFTFIPNKIIEKIDSYINSPMTATWFNETDNKSSREIITSELIYYWMIAYQIPFQCENWHLNRLLALIRVCSIKNQPPKKMGRSEILRRNKVLNEQRLRALNTKG